MASKVDSSVLRIQKIIPADVKGVLHDRRTMVHGLLMILFLSLPWIQIGESQAVWLDVSRRQFHLLGVLFQAHEVPLLFFILSLSFLSLAFVTSLWGRVWCGWACPQTVFVDAVFRRIEKWVEGNYRKRRLGEVSVFRKILKWLLFFVVSSALAHSFLAYFVGSKNLLAMMQNSPTENWSYFVLVFAMTALVLFDFGWFREQFCVVLCPYGRFQNVLLEPNSVAVVFDRARKDCVECNRCVEVCPTGIDIRNGLQMECINCTACIDACNDIMKKVNKPKDLIGYKTLSGKPFRFWSLKSGFYLLLMALGLSGFGWSLSQRADVDVTVLRGAGLPFTANETEVINHFKLHLVNQTHDTQKYEIRLPAPLELVTAEKQIKLRGGEFKEWHIFVKSPRTLFENGKLKVKLELVSGDKIILEKDLTLLGPNL